MERRLAGASAAKTVSPSDAPTPPESLRADSVEVEAVDADSVSTASEPPSTVVSAPGVPEESGWPDAAAESAFLAEAKSRGELPAPKPAPAEEAEEADTAPLPPMDKMVERIPPPVREMLDDLFRARFVRVARIPRRALKS